MRRGSLRERVRAAAQELDKAGDGFSEAQLSDFLGVQTWQQQKSLNNAVKQLLAAGDHLRRRPDGRLGKVAHPPGAPSKNQIMYRFLYQNRRAPVETLMAVAVAAESTVKQFGRLLERRGLGKLENGEIYLSGDPELEAPFDTERADRARAWRQRLQAAQESLDAAFVTVAADCPGQGEGLRAIVAAMKEVAGLEEE